MHHVSIWLNAVHPWLKHTKTSSWHAVQHASSWLLLCYASIQLPLDLLFVSSWLNAIKHQYMYVAQCCVYIRHQYGYALCINMTQCCASCIKMARFGSIICIMYRYGCSTMHQINPVHPKAQYSASTAHWCASDINSSMLYFWHLMWLCCIMLQYGSMLCIQSSMMCIRHQYGLILCIKHTCMAQYGSMLCIRHHYSTI